MKRYIVILFAVLSLAACCERANAEQVTISIPGSLSDEQERMIQAAAFEAVSKMPVVPSAPAEVIPTTPAEVEKWGMVFNAIGTGIANTAKQLGIAANEFAKTPVGIITILLVVWNYAGQELITIAFGFVWLLATIPLWFYSYRRIGVTKETKFDKDNEKANGRMWERVVEDHGQWDTTRGLHFVVLLAICLVGVACIVA